MSCVEHTPIPLVMYSHSCPSLSLWKTCTSFFSLNLFIFQSINAHPDRFKIPTLPSASSLSRYLQTGIRVPLSLFSAKKIEWILKFFKFETLKFVIDSNDPDGSQSHPCRFWLNIPRVCRAKEQCNKESGVSAFKT